MRSYDALRHSFDLLLSRVAEGRVGRDLDAHPGDGPRIQAVYDGVCHVHGHDYWRWEGLVICAPHRRWHLDGVLTALDQDGEELQSYPYGRTLEIP